MKISIKEKRNEHAVIECHCFEFEMSPILEWCRNNNIVHYLYNYSNKRIYLVLEGDENVMAFKLRWM